jgi:hypothetical protein
MTSDRSALHPDTSRARIEAVFETAALELERGTSRRRSPPMASGT